MTDGALGNNQNSIQKKDSIAIFMPKTDEKGKPLSDKDRKDNSVLVHFNPEFLDITFTKSVGKGGKNQPAQVSVPETTATISMELIFDTTLTGKDVMVETNKLARMMDPSKEIPFKEENRKKIPPIVIFSWGTVLFEGYIDSYKEKLDYFSSEGVPLRAAVSLSMTQQIREFVPTKTDDNLSKVLSPEGNKVLNRNNESINAIGSNNSLTDLMKTINSSSAGCSAATRLVAAANGIESIRFPEVKDIVMPSFGTSATAGVNLSFNTSEAGGGLSMAGTTEGLFSNLKKSENVSPGAALSFDMKSNLSAGIGLDAGASIGLGGSLGAGGGSSMTADVGVSADIELGIKFGD